MRVVTATLLVGALIGGVALVLRQAYFAPKTITAYFVSATGIYQGDEVRVAGVKVGTISAIDPVGAQTRMTLQVERDVPIPVDAKAVIVAQSLVASRYVQLAPAYETSGPIMPDDAVIPVDRTAIPVEWDQVKDQLTRLATDLGPQAGMSGTSLSRFIDSAANAMNGNGDKLRRTIAELSGLARTLAEGSGNIVDTITNLQTFVSALSDSDQQIVEFQNRFATLTSVVNDDTDIVAALADLNSAVVDVQRFVAGSRDQTAEQIQRLSNVTQNLVDRKLDIENLLHAAPNAVSNGYNIYSPDTGSQVGRFALNNFSNPMALLCNAIGAAESVTSAESAKLCAQTLGPALDSVTVNQLPFGISPLLMKSPSPDRLIYTEPGLAPGGSGPKPVALEIPPAVSAYTGTDPAGPAPPPGVLPGPTAPDHLPAPPMPAFPGAPIPSPTTFPDMMLPAEAGAPTP